MLDHIDYFIVCHDQNIILQRMQQDAPNYRYLFVGHSNNTKLNNQTIICKHLKQNIEGYPNLCSFTAWYALARNNISIKNQICLLEYDAKLTDRFYRYHENTVTNYINDQTIIAYSYTLTDHYVFYKSTPWLELSLMDTYGINLNDFIQDIKNQHPVWPTTTNMCMTKQTLERFVEWFLPMTILFREDPLGSYVHERAFFVFCILNNIEIKYIKNPVLSHNQQKSHQNLDIYGKVLDMYKTTVLTQDMISNYDRIYDEAYQISLINCSK
jgi:hypothetical protein